MLRKLSPRFLEKIWGAPAVDPWFVPDGRNIGEVWFENEPEPARPELPLLIKFIFTKERLSVQVHPDDAQARARGLERGKTEMWHVLRAEPGAQLALGFRHKLDVETARRAALDGSIVDLLRWFDVQPGESYLVPAGTVHAIGAGLCVCEVQQTADTTYRLFDYGRGRELHLDAGLAVAQLEPWHGNGAVPSSTVEPWRADVRCPYFETQTATAVTHPCVLDPVDAPLSYYVFTDGRGHIGGERYHAGECWLVEGSCAGVSIEPARPTSILRAIPLSA
jgi:mannose-6-phosphate isomerase